MAKQGWAQVEYLGPFRNSPPRVYDSFYDPDIGRNKEIHAQWVTLETGQIVSGEAMPPGILQKLCFNASGVPSEIYRVYDESKTFDPEDIKTVQLSSLPNSEQALREENAALKAQMDRLERDLLINKQMQGKVEEEQRLIDLEAKQEAERLKPKPRGRRKAG